jgi:hypothetical protein
VTDGIGFAFFWNTCLEEKFLEFIRNRGNRFDKLPFVPAKEREAVLVGVVKEFLEIGDRINSLIR